MHRSARTKAVMPARAEVRILGAFSWGVSTHLQGHNAVVNVAHRDQEPWGAGQCPPALRTLDIDPESRHPCADVGTTAFNQVPRECCTAFQRKRAVDTV